MPICPKCRIEYEEGKKFCRECGTALVERPSEAPAPPSPTSAYASSWQDAREIRTLSVHFDSVMAVAVSPDGRTIACGYGWECHTVKLWDLRTKQLRTFTWRIEEEQKDSEGVASVAFSADGQTLASLDTPGTLKLWGIP